MIAAILQAQWRSMRSFRTGALSVSTVVSWISGLLFYGFWAAAAFGAQAFFASAANVRYFGLALPGALLLVLLYWQITPIVTASMGASLDLKKLLAYPVGHAKLFLVELLLRVTTCLEMVIVLIGIAAGLIRNPEIWRAPLVLPVVLLYLALNVLLAAGMRNLLERLLKKKGTREVMTALLLAFTVLPQFLLLKRFRPDSFDAGALPDAPYLPWTAASHLILGASVWVPVLALTLLSAAAYLFSRSQFEAGLRFDGASVKVRPSGGRPRAETLFRWPSAIFPDPIAAIIEKELRSLIRTPQFRFIFLTGAAFGLVIYLPTLIGRRNPNAFLSQNILAFSCVYGVLLLGNVSYFNCFGYDRSAVQAWFSFPVPLRITLVAKNLTALIFVVLEVAMVMATALVFRFQMQPVQLFEALLVALIAALYLIAFGNIASVFTPRSLNPEQISQAGSAKAKNLIILAFFPVLILPIGLAYWARAVFESSLAFYGLLAFALLLGAILYVIGLDTAVKAGSRKREALLTALSRGEGPLTAT